MDEFLREFGPSAPPPGLKDRILAGARRAPHPGLVDRLWNRSTWMTIAAGALAAAGLYALSLRPIRLDLDLAEKNLNRAVRVWTKGSSPSAMVARLGGPHELHLEDVK
jgi:hypothetical protein